MKKLFYLVAFMTTMLCFTTVTSCSQDDELDYCEQESLLKTKATRQTTGGRSGENTKHTSASRYKQPKNGEQTISVVKSYILNHEIRQWDPFKGRAEWNDYQVCESFYFTFAYTFDDDSETTTGRCITAYEVSGSAWPAEKCLYLKSCPSSAQIYKDGNIVYVGAFNVSIGTNVLSNIEPKNQKEIGIRYNYNYEELDPGTSINNTTHN